MQKTSGFGLNGLTSERPFQYMYTKMIRIKLQPYDDEYTAVMFILN
jgi:hypothetical protein